MCSSTPMKVSLWSVDERADILWFVLTDIWLDVSRIERIKCFQCYKTTSVCFFLSSSAVPVTRLAWLKCKTPAVRHPPWPKLPQLITPRCFKVDLRDREQILLHSAAAGVHSVSLQMEILLSSNDTSEENISFTSSVQELDTKHIMQT